MKLTFLLMQPQMIIDFVEVEFKVILMPFKSILALPWKLGMKNNYLPGLLNEMDSIHTFTLWYLFLLILLFHYLQRKIKRLALSSIIVIQKICKGVEATMELVQAVCLICCSMKIKVKIREDKWCHPHRGGGRGSPKGDLRWCSHRGEVSSKSNITSKYWKMLDFLEEKKQKLMNCYYQLCLELKRTPYFLCCG